MKRRASLLTVFLGMMLLAGGCATAPGGPGENVMQTFNEYRDQHLSRAQELEKAGDFSTAREMYAIALTTDPGCVKASEGVQRMERALQESSQQFYKEGIRLQKQGRYGQANQRFLMALRLWPECTEALTAITERRRMPKVPYIVHKVESGDSLSKIAQRYYGDSRKFHIIAEYNKLTDVTQLRLGQELKVPMPGQSSRLEAESEQEPEQQKNADQTVPSALSDAVLEEDEQMNALFEVSGAGTGEESASAAMDQVRIYREQGIELFTDGKFEDSLVEFNKVLCVDPDDKVTVDYCYKANFQIGLKLFEGKDYLAARDRFNKSLKLQNNCKQCHTYINKSETLYKEMHYRMGMQYYGQEQIVEAIQEWEMIRSLDPEYKKVGSLINKAETILKKLEEIKKNTKKP